VDVVGLRKGHGREALRRGRRVSVAEKSIPHFEPDAEAETPAPPDAKAS
jgi:hypothetical protein